ncbi:P-loop NTPase fold protein [Chitinophaga arvensicola]|uniref:KAP family P-loop domain-containing protein n=1 Tax=Chitinophaga arvensicola TaxID=29529 RepID=A0A1I0SFV5_9BACT|nr:P-loop NTPase fold protein [Chitinophaga arvensicola]SEW56462.1 KAP family P-loop domain-containing protein [Chitinophaga arvensicola]
METPFFNNVFNYPITEFEKHLKQESNNRIFFSGRYGTGKTSFITRYFGHNECRDLYEVYHLFPVNYSISSNEDIIKYIKYDIILGMLERNESFPEESKGYLKTLPAFLLKRMDKVFEAILSMVPEVGKSVLDMYEKLGKLKDEYLSYHDQENIGDGDKLAEYIDVLEGQNGSLVENDVITKIISAKIQSSRPKESILVVDDLDRLDPEHVFRILNVFAAHFDTKASTRDANKFGFDKVIIVGDIENIRNIFHHRYGSQVDFTGYIDKFYSSDIYHFDNRGAMEKVAEKVVNSYTLDGNKDRAMDLYFKDGFLFAIIKSLLEKGNLSLRAILNTYSKELTYHNEDVDLMYYHKVSAWRVPMIYRLKYLSELIGGKNNLVAIFEKFKRGDIIFDDISFYPGNLLYILNYNIEGRQKGLTAVIYKDEEYLLEPERDFYSDSISRVKMYKSLKSGINGDFSKGEEYRATVDEFWQLNIDVVNRLNVLGYIK